MAEVPQPKKGASDIFEVSSAILSTLLPPLTILKAGADILVRKRMEDGQRLLISEIEDKGVSGLSDEKWDYYVPAAYRFFEQVRLGEYEHNLRILAKLIAGDLSESNASTDLGKVGRAARKLEMLTKEQLLALSKCPRAFEIYEASSESDGYWICIEEQELQASFAEDDLIVKPIECQEWLHELSCRGILTSGGRPSRVGGTFYYRNSVFNEIIAAASELVEQAL